MILFCRLLEVLAMKYRKYIHSKISMILIVCLLPGLLLCACQTAGSQSEPRQTDPEQIIEPLDPARSDPALEPVLITLPRLTEDSQFSTWRSEARRDAYIALGGQFGRQEGAQGRVDYYGRNGTRLWSFVRPWEQDHCVFNTAVMFDNGQVAAAGSVSDSKHPEQGIVTLLDAEGQLIWEKRLANEHEQVGLTIDQLLIDADGNLIAAALQLAYDTEVNADNLSVVFFKLDPSGNLISQWGIPLGEQRAYSLQIITDQEDGFWLALDGYMAVKDGQSASFSLILHLDAAGQMTRRIELVDEQYLYRVVKLAMDDAGSIWLACSTDWLGQLPGWGVLPDPELSLRERYRHYACRPAALLFLDGEASFSVSQMVNGAFGADSRDLLIEEDHLIWLIQQIDDVIPSLPIMSIDHMRVGHKVVIDLDLATDAVRPYHMAAEWGDDWVGTGEWKIQRIDNGRPVLIGFAAHRWEYSSFEWPEPESTPGETSARPEETKESKKNT
jgi:hypothetical protein